MAVQAFTYLVMTDGTDTVTFGDGLGGTGGSQNWPLQRDGWAPAIAGVRTSELGGRGPYADVAEDITCNVLGTTAALSYANLDTLSRLLDKADRWWRKNENISPVLLKYVPQGSTIHSSSGTMLQAVVLGRAGADEVNGAALPKDMDSAGVLFEIYGVQISCIRRGAWLSASENASAAAVANPAVLSVTMPSGPSIPGSLKIGFTGFTTAAATGNIEIPDGYVFVGPNNSMTMIQGESATAGGSGPTFSSVADAARRASGGNVGRLTSIVVTPYTPTNLTWTLPAAFLTATRIAIFCTYRNNNAISWTLAATGYTGLATNPLTPTITLAAAVTDPTVLYLGEVASPTGFDTVRIDVASSTNAGGNILDIDTLAVLDMSSNEVYVIAQGGAQYALGASFASKNTQLTINNDPLTQRYATVNAPILTTALTVPIDYSGDVYLVGKGTILQAMWYATHLYVGTPYWTTQNITGAAILSIGCTITRRLSYLSPQ